MAILKLECLTYEARRYDPPQYHHVNSDQIRRFWEIPNGVAVEWAGSGEEDGLSFYALSADELASAIDPENACPKPGRCGYPEYLSYRKEGQTDLGHGAYHAAETIAEGHMRDCRVYENGRECSLCRSFEERLRA